MTEEKVFRVAMFAIEHFINNHLEFGHTVASAKLVSVNTTIHHFVEGHEWPETDWKAVEEKQQRKGNDE